ncbi:MAG TPA: flagellar biosynthesis protein FlhF [Bacillota bacterium]|nr:flagellar biosynthesis protein FlhF [Bacillota bacterium]
MKIKKYVAPTMPEAMRKIRKDLGSDAVILNSKEVRNGGFLGLFKKRNIEVIAALDPEPEKREKKATPSSQSYPMPKRPHLENENRSVLDEIQHLKKLIAQQNRQFDSYPPDYQVVFQYLLDQELEEDLAREIVDAVVNKHEEQKDQKAFNEILEDTRLEITKRLKTLSFTGITFDKQIVHFVGPTGVGKTTTLAKVAAHNMLKQRKQIAFVTVDTYRIAAIDQLRTYADILDVPLEVAYDINDYLQALDQFKDYDLILVDTAGRNFRDKRYINELKQSIVFNDTVETYLVLSVTAKAKDILDVYEQFRQIPIKELIFTKVDETNQYGSILNLALKHQLGVACLTNGQNVPDDIITPSPEMISSYVMGGYYDV